MKAEIRNSLSVLMLTLALVVMGAVTTIAQEQTQPEAPKAVTGKVASVDAAKGMLEVKDHGGKSLALTVNAQTKVTKDGKEITLAEVKTGDSVNVEYDDAGGAMTARKVTVMAARAGK